MAVDLTTLTPPAAPGKTGGSSGFLITIVLVVVGFLIYKFFSYSNDKAKEEN
jgi:hypothetical protein